MPINPISQESVWENNAIPYWEVLIYTHTHTHTHVYTRVDEETTTTTTIIIIIIIIIIICMYVSMYVDRYKKKWIQ